MKITSSQTDITLTFEGANFAELESHLYDYGAEVVRAESYVESATWEDSTVEAATVAALGAIDAYVEEMNETLNKRFKDEIAPLVIAQYSADDTVALDEAFNNWTDSLCKGGEICDSVYNGVCREESE